jgi:hypothetical protein
MQKRIKINSLIINKSLKNGGKFMKKLMILFTILITSLTLVGCTDSSEVIVPPTFQGFTVNGSSPATDGELDTFYKGKQGTIVLELSFTNPSNAEIKSINIDGYTFNSSRFLDDSTSTLIRLEVNVGDDLGERIYSIDEFSYLNGESAVTLNISSNNEYKIYVYKDFPEISRASYNISKEQITVTYSVTDIDDIIIPGTLKAIIYDGDTAIDTITITDKQNAVVTFTGLYTDKQYDIKIYASFDRDDTTGQIDDYLFTTDPYVTLSNSIPSASISNLNMESSKVFLKIDITDEDTVITNGGLSVVLYKGDQLLQTKSIAGDITNLSFEGLDNNTEYTVKVIANYNLNDGNENYTSRELASETFETSAIDKPVAEIVGLVTTDDSIDFDINIVDPYSTLDTETIQAFIYIDGEEAEASIDGSHVSMNINNLFANQEFTIIIKASYDLYDGNGMLLDQEIANETFSTNGNAKPSISSYSILVEQGYITLSLNVNDPNNTLIAPLVAKLYQIDIVNDEEEVITVLDTILFDKTTSEVVFHYASQKGTTYYIDVLADYNLRDGKGAVYEEFLVTQTAYTAQVKAPVVEVNDITYSTNGIEFDIHIIDADNTILPNTTYAKLYDKDGYITSFVITSNDMSVFFNGLLSNHQYRIDIVTKFDLDDGTETILESVIDSISITTAENELPTVVITEETVTVDSVVVDVVFTDNSDVLDMTSLTAKIFNISDLEQAVQTIDLTGYASNDVTFNSLYSNNQYIVRVYATYDLRDGLPEITTVLGEFGLKTVAKIVPTVSFENIVTTNRTLTVDLRVDDNSNVIDGDLYAVLYDSEGVTSFTKPLVTNADLELTFEGLLSNEQYTIRVFGDYNLNDQVNDFTHAQLAESDKVFTDPLSQINITLPNIDSTLDTIDFGVDILDVDNVIVGDTKVNLYKLENGEVTGSSLGEFLLNDLSYDLLTFTGLTTNTSYRLVFTSEYSLNDKIGPVTTEIGRYDISTKQKVPPVAAILDPVVTESDISFNMTFTDKYNVLIEGTLFARLLDDEGTVIAYKNITSNNVTFDLTGFLANQQLTIEIYGNYDLEDGTNVHSNQTFGSYDFTTVSFSIPEVTINDVTPTQNTVEATITVRDEDDVITGNLFAGLYKYDELLEQDVLLETIDLGVGVNYISFAQRMESQEMYTVKVFADYNLRDGNPTYTDQIMAEHIELLNSKFLPEATISGVIPGKESVTFLVSLFDFHDVIKPGSTVVQLYHNGTLVATSNPISEGDTSITFETNLEYTILSNSNYELYVRTTYTVDENVGERENQVLYKTEFKTQEKTLPSLNIVNKNSYLKESIDVSATITDTDGVVANGSMRVVLYKANDLNTVVEEKVLPGLVLNNDLFDNLLSDTRYTVYVYASYDLNDDQGLNEYLLGTENITTAAKDVPDVTLEYVTFGKESMSMDVYVNDDDDVITGNLIVVLENSEGIRVSQPILSNTQQTVSFSNLLSNEEYRIYVYADYDMNDEIRIFQDFELLKSSKYETLAMREMEVTFQNQFSTLDSISFDAYITDPDLVARGGLQARIFTLDDTINPVATTDLEIGPNSVTFTELNSDTDYVVFIYSSYDLNTRDTYGVNTKIATLSLKTLTKLPPETIKTGTSITENEVTFDITLDDPFNVFVEGTLKASLYKGETLITSKIVQSDAIAFDLSEFLSNQEFTIKLTGSYDLEDGNGVQVNKLFGQYTFTTLEKTVPSVESGNLNITQETVEIDLTINDPDTVISSDILIEFFDVNDVNNETPLHTITVSKINYDYYTNNHTYVFNETLNIGEAYLISVTTNYDLNDGTGVKTKVLFEQIVYIDGKLAPEAKIVSESHTQDSITLTIDVIDEYNTIIPGTTVVDLKLNGEVVATSAPISGLNQVVVFDTDIISNQTYTYSIRTDYDKDNDILNGFVEDANITFAESNSVTTSPKQLLTGSINIENTTIDSIIIDMLVVDPDSVREANSLYLYVYEADDLLNPIHTFNLVNLSYDDYTISGLDSNSDYVLQLVADYDLDEQENPVIISDYVLSNQSVRTVARNPISATIDYYNLSGTTLTVDITILDLDNTLTGNLKVVLYDSQGETAFVYNTLDGLTVGINSSITFTGLLNDEPYYIYVFADYDLYDTVNVYTDEVLTTSTRISTNEKTPMNATINSLSSDLNSITIDVSVLDLDSVYTNNLNAVLYLTSDLSTPVSTIPLVVGSNSVTFNGLNSDTSYTIKIVSDYNLNNKYNELNGDYLNRLLTEDSISTLIKVKPTVTVTNLQITKSEVSFNISVNDPFDVYQENSLSAVLYVDGVERSTKYLSTDQVTFDLSSLLADQDFTIEIYADYDLDDGFPVDDGLIGTIEDTTIAYQIPQASIGTVTAKQQTVDVEVTVTDNDETITQNLVAYIQNEAGVTLDTVSLSTGFNQVSFNVTVNEREQYSIFIQTDYNLRDVDGEQTNYIMQEFVKYVDNKLVPETTITNVSFDKYSITFTPTVYDVDAIISGDTVVKLYLGTELKQTSAPIGLGGTPITFNTLLSNNEYKLVVETSYDDGSAVGEIPFFEMAEYLVTTTPLVPVEFDVITDTFNSNSIIFDIVVTDIDNVTTSMDAVLYHNQTEVDRVALIDGDNVDVTFTNLNGSTSYDLVIEYVNNANDGQGDVNMTFESTSVTTDEAIVPTSTLTVTPATNSLTVDYTLVDSDNVLITSDLVLYLDDSEVSRIAIAPGTDTYTFTNLIHNSNYRVEVEVSYDLYNLEGLQTVAIAVDDTDTNSIISIESVVMGKKDGTVVIDINDPNNVIDSYPVTVNLKRGATIIYTELVFGEVEATIDLFNLLSDYTYTLEIVADIDFGDGLQTDYVLYTEEVTTLPLQEVTASIENAQNWDFSGSNIEFDVTADTDTDNVVTDGSWTALIYEDGVLKETIVFANPEGTTVAVTTVGSSTDGEYDNTLHKYTIVITATVDMNDQPSTPGDTEYFAQRTYINMNEN